MSLKKYKAKRNLEVSKEPPAKIHKHDAGKLRFVVQKHAATRLHFDFRLEVHGVLKSWAVPKGPSMNPKDKRLAVKVEDHPYEYKDFEGIIPEGYGAGTVIIWDQGTYSVEGKPPQESEERISEGLEKGEVHFTLEGSKLKGEFALVRINEEKDEWLLIKKRDDFASDQNVLLQDQSVVSGLTIEKMGAPKKKKAALPQNLPMQAPKVKMFHHVEPMLATLIDAPFDDEEWIFEIKLDGYRAIAEMNGVDVALYSRNMQPFNERFPQVVEALKKLNTQAIFDGEVVALDEKGISRFQLLQNVQKRPLNIAFFIFDLIYFQGHDLRPLSLVERKALLKKILDPFSDTCLQYNDHIENKGIEFYQLAIREDLEGIIGKKKQSAYLPGRRTKDWVKIKRILKQEVVICGFTQPKGSRKEMGALVVGVYRDGVLSFAGHVGGGFSEEKLKKVKELLDPYIQKACPFKNPPKTNTKVTWVKPRLLCEVAFSEWTQEGSMRQPIFLGIRQDKPPQAVTKEEPIKKEKVLKKEASKKASSVAFTNLEKIYFPKEKITKGDVIEYYISVAPYLLPFLKDRPQSLKRFPEGINEPSFYQKNIEKAPSWIHTIKIPHKDKIVNYLLIQDLDSLLYAVNLGCIEIHPFSSRIQSLDYPDFFIFDLDPEDIPFEKVVETAQALHDVLEKIHVPSFCKTSGATGLHICVPLGAKYTYEQAKVFANIIAHMTHQMVPDFTSLERIPKKRQKKVYIDYLQNNPGQTIAAPYSLRARPGAPVSTPLEWGEVKEGLHPLNFTIDNTLQRLKKKGDLFKPLLKKGISIEIILKNMEAF